jgi:hypothetical protein
MRLTAAKVLEREDRKKRTHSGRSLRIASACDRPTPPSSVSCRLAMLALLCMSAARCGVGCPKIPSPFNPSGTLALAAACVSSNGLRAPA